MAEVDFAPKFAPFLGMVSPSVYIEALDITFSSTAYTDGLSQAGIASAVSLSH